MAVFLKPEYYQFTGEQVSPSATVVDKRFVSFSFFFTQNSPDWVDCGLGEDDVIYLKVALHTLLTLEHLT